LQKPNLDVEEVISIVRRKQEERIAKYGAGYKILIDDYPAKLTTTQNSKGNYSKRTVDEIVYNNFAQLALENNFHSLCAIQTNREGSKVNKGQKEDRLLTMEDVLESWGAMTTATNVWTINRDPMAKVKNRLTYYIDKSRSSETGFAVVCRTKFGNSITHSDKLGATYYQAYGTYSDKVDKLLGDYNGRKIDHDVLESDD